MIVSVLTNKAPDQFVSAEVLLADERSGVFASVSDKRMPIVDWLMEVAVTIKASTNVYLKSVKMLEAFLSRERVYSKRDRHLAAAACLQLACTHEALWEEDVKNAIEYEDGALYDKEIEVFKALGCSASMPTEKSFLDVIFAHTLPDNKTLRLAMLFSTVMTLFDFPYLPSVRATAYAQLAQRIHGGREIVNVFGIPQNVIEKCVSLIVQAVGELDKTRRGYYLRLPGWNDSFWSASDPVNSTTIDYQGDEYYLVSTYFKPSIRLTHIPSQYEVEEIIGEGGFGQISKVFYKGTAYAVKRAQDENEYYLSEYMVREISIMQSLSDDNVVKLCHITSNLSAIFLELGEGDLKDMVRRGPIPDINQTDFALQMLHALTYIHNCGVLHRDIKPENIIYYDTDGGILYKLSDFGLGRGCDIALRNGNYSTEVCTLHYRPPELLLGSAMYNDRIDVWSMMCTFYEAATSDVLFLGDSEIDQTLKIFRALGVPDERTWPGVTSLPQFDPLKYGRQGEYDPFDRLSFNDTFKSLVKYGLVMNPNRRPSAQDLQDALLGVLN